MIELLLIVGALVLVAACGLFVAAEFSFLTVNRTAVERLAAKGDSDAQGVSQALKTLSTQLSGAQVGITITNLAIGFLAEPAITALIEPAMIALGVPENLARTLALLIGIALATAVTMVGGELIPKNLAIAKPMAVARRVQRFQRGFSHIMKYPIILLNNSANFLLKGFNVVPQEELGSARSADELTSLVRRSAEQGTLPRETALMLERTLSFGELMAIDIMTPRVHMRCVRADDPVEQVLATARATGLSRFPVIRESPDDVVGLVHIKNAVGIPRDQRGLVQVERIMQPLIAVPSSIALEPLLEQLRKGGLQMAVVIDEFGGTDGLVTIEDLIEELVGDVQDEHDRIGAVIRKRKAGGWILSGLLRPDEIAEELGIFLPDEDEFETIGGLVSDRLERIPAVGDTANIEAVDRLGEKLAVSLRVERMDGRRVDRVLMQAAAEVESQAGQEQL